MDSEPVDNIHSRTITLYECLSDVQIAGLADEVLTLGFTRPRVVETVEELEALPNWSVVRTSDQCINERQTDGWIMIALNQAFASDKLALPATVLFVGGEE